MHDTKIAKNDEKKSVLSPSQLFLAWSTPSPLEMSFYQHGLTRLDRLDFFFAKQEKQLGGTSAYSSSLNFHMIRVYRGGALCVI